MQDEDEEGGELEEDVEEDEDEMTQGDDEEEEDGLEIPDPAVVLANKRVHPLFARLFRSKGEYWLATRPTRAGEWSQAGAMLTLAGGRPWFVCIDRSEWETGSSEIDELVDHDLTVGGKYGDRRQEIVFIGENLDIPAIEATLDECLLIDSEWKSWQSIMLKGSGPNRMGPSELSEKTDALNNLFDDGFPSWDESDEFDHDHPSHGHGQTCAIGRDNVESIALKAKHGVKKDGSIY